MASNKRVADLGTPKGQKQAQQQFDRYGQALQNMSVISRIIGKSSPMVGGMIEEVSQGQIEDLAGRYTKDLQKEYTRQLNRRRQGADQSRQQRRAATARPPSNRGTIADFGKTPAEMSPKPASQPKNPWSWTDSGDWLG